MALRPVGKTPRPQGVDRRCERRGRHDRHDHQPVTTRPMSQHKVVRRSRHIRHSPSRVTRSMQSEFWILHSTSTPPRAVSSGGCTADHSRAPLCSLFCELICHPADSNPGLCHPQYRGWTPRDSAGVHFLNVFTGAPGGPRFRLLATRAGRGTIGGIVRLLSRARLNLCIGTVVALTASLFDSGPSVSYTPGSSSTEILSGN